MFSATISVANMPAANAALEGLGYGPGNFSVPLRTGTAEATHAGFNSGEVDGFKADVEALRVTYPDLTVFPSSEELARPSPPQVDAVPFSQIVAAQSLEWADPADWFTNPVMAGDERSFGGKNWASLIDTNVWQPPIGWRELVLVGYPAWVQPVGSIDAYPLDFTVTHDGKDWNNTGSDANVWEPGVFGWVDVTVVSVSAEWAYPVAYTIGDEVTYQGTLYRCRQSHTSQAGWTPPAVLSLWLPI